MSDSMPIASHLEEIDFQRVWCPSQYPQVFEVNGRFDLRALAGEDEVAPRLTVVGDDAVDVLLRVGEGIAREELC